MKYEGKSIFFIGDSITANGTFLKYLRTYFKRTGMNIATHNKGIPGGTYQILNTALEEELLDMKPGFAVLCFGVNDSRYWEYNVDSLNTEKLEATRENQRRIYKENMAKAVNTLRENGIAPILCSPFAVSRFLNGAQGIETVVDSKEKSCINDKFYNAQVFAKINESLAEFRDIVKAFAEENGIEFFDIFDAVYTLTEPPMYKEDGIHFSIEGNKLIAKLIFKNLFCADLNEFEIDEEFESLAERESDERAYYFIKYNIMRPVVKERTTAELAEKVKEWIKKMGNVQGLTKEREEGFFRFIADHR